MTRVFGIVVGLGFFYWLFFHANVVWIFRTQYAVIFSIIFLSITVITGMAGEISLCQATFAGIGALATAQLAHELGMSVLVGMLLAGVIAAAVGALVRAARAATRRHLPVARDVRLRALLRQRDGELHVGERWQRHHAAEDTPATDRPDRLRQREVVPRAVSGDPRDRRAPRRVGCAAARPGGSSTRCAAARSRRPPSGSTRPAARITAFALSAGLAGVGGGLLAMREQAASYNTFFVAQFGLLWVVIVVSLGARTVEGAIQAAVGFIFFQRVVLEDWIPWIFNHVLGPAMLVVTAVIVLALVRGHFGVFAAIAALFGVSFFVYYLVGAPGWTIDSVPTGLATVFFGIGAITYAKHPEGVLEHNKRKSLAATQAWLDKLKARRNGTDVGEPPPDVPASRGAPVGAPQ